MNKFYSTIYFSYYYRNVGCFYSTNLSPILYGKHSSYSISVGWQEIGIWNLAVLIIILAVNIKYDGFYLKLPSCPYYWWYRNRNKSLLEVFIEFHSPVNTIGAIEIIYSYLVGSGGLLKINNKTQNSL